MAAWAETSTGVIDMAFIAGGPALAGAYKQNARMCKCQNNPVRNPSRMSSLDGVPLAGLGLSLPSPVGIVSEMTSPEAILTAAEIDRIKLEKALGFSRPARGKNTALLVGAAAVAALLLLRK
jgi:hypothetical protein